MARIRGHAKLDENKPLYVMRRSITVDDVTYEIGEELPWRRIPGVTPRKIRQLHDQRKVGHERPDAPARGAEDPERSPMQQATADARAAGREAPPPWSKPPAKTQRGGRLG